ncbi:MAG TPA: hypothetical protein ACFYEF_09770 [Candidatus Wunengus sp. YC63]|uniref:hypothetical protein n=1 Tax=Candidatus Wunengus sp. YC63 TaxID=3367699 RepID=UPI004026CE72
MRLPSVIATVLLMVSIYPPVAGLSIGVSVYKDSGITCDDIMTRNRNGNDRMDTALYL